MTSYICALLNGPPSIVVPRSFTKISASMLKILSTYMRMYMMQNTVPTRTIILVINPIEHLMRIVVLIVKRYFLVDSWISTSISHSPIDSIKLPTYTSKNQ
jgi:hypothetical protein